MPIQRACDRCYKYKEKCHFDDDAEACGQCRRSRSTCTTTLRSRPRQGRRPKVKRLGPNSSVQVWEVSRPPSGAKLDQTSTLRHAQGLSPATSKVDTSKFYSIYHSPASSLLMSLIDDPEELRETSPFLIQKFYTHYDVFMLGPSFAAPQRAAFQRSYVGSPLLLRDIFIAIYTAMTRARYSINVSDQSDVAQGASSLQKLRNAKIKGTEDALAVMALGQTLAAFDVITKCIGCSLILRYSLSSAQPWYAELSQNPSFDPVTITPIFWDTICCLVRREIPVIRFQPRNSQTVDRVAGLCTTLLPILYDLCVASHKIKSHSEMYSQINTSPLGRIEQRLLSWTPEVPYDFTNTFSKQEVLGMKSQALMHQKAALLIVHRIVHPVGTQDDVAKWYASTIVLESLKYPLCTPWNEKQHPICSTLPILLAALEIPDIPRETWEGIGLLNVATRCSQRMQAFIDYVWKERRGGYHGFILDLVDTGPDFVVVP